MLAKAWTTTVMMVTAGSQGHGGGDCGYHRTGGTGESEAQTAWFGSKSSQRDVEFSLAFPALCDFYGPSSGHIILGEQQGGNEEGTGSQEAPGE